MDLKEAIKKAKDEDTIINSSFCDTFSATKSRILGLKTTVAVSLSEDWYIIPIKRYMTDAKEWLDDHSVFPLQKDFEDSLTDAWQASAENTHLLYADLMEAIKKPADTMELWYEQVVSAYNKVNAVLTPTSSTG